MSILDNSANIYDYTLDMKEFDLSIYRYFKITTDAFDPTIHEYSLKVKLRQCVKNPNKFDHLCNYFKMTHLEILAIIHDKYPRIFNKKTKNFIRNEYDLTN